MLTIATLSPFFNSNEIGLNISCSSYFIFNLFAKISEFLLFTKGIIFKGSFLSIFLNKLVFSFTDFSMRCSITFDLFIILEALWPTNPLSIVVSELYFLLFPFSASFDHLSEFFDAISSLSISFCSFSFCIISKLSCFSLFSFQVEKLPCIISILVLFIAIIWSTTLSKNSLS